jgi:hypothetical protein
MIVLREIRLFGQTGSVQKKIFSRVVGAGASFIDFLRAVGADLSRLAGFYSSFIAVATLALTKWPDYGSLAASSKR